MPPGSQLQSASFGTSGLGYGDFFAAAVVGGILAAERGPQLVDALGMVAVSLCWDQLFLVYDILPATIPPAIVLIAVSFHFTSPLTVSPFKVRYQRAWNFPRNRSSCA